jgi:TolB-like protein/DNA-binding SARP family transcriptional activator/Flp pilus assembly protein TadD
MVRLNLFGTASIDVAGVPVTGRAAQGRRVALLALLACARGRSLTRDRLIALLWPDSSTERARRQLSDDIYIVRSGLGEDVLRSAGDELSLDPAAITSDVETFERLLDEGRLEEAVAQFAGPLLDGFHLSDGAEFERWLEAERARLGQRFDAALQSLAEASEARGQPADAVAWWRKLAARDPYSGRVTLRLMRALEAVGDRAGAIRQSRVHTSLLREEFDADPDPEMTAYAERLRVAPPAMTPEPALAAPPPSAPPPTEPAPTEPAPEQPEDTAEAATDPTSTADSAPTAVAAPAPGGPARPGTVAPSITPAPAPPAGRRRGVRRAAGVLLLLAVVAVGALVASSQHEATDPRPAARAAVPSIGVLPFLNMSADPENTYFSDGLTEQIITALSHIDGLRVAARTSSFALRDGQLDVRAIGDTLGVAAVLEGSVRTDGRRLRITAQLIDAATGYHVWSDVYDREIDDVFAVQDEIADAIAVALELRLAGSGIAPRSPPAIDLEAYDLYLRGLFMRNSLTADRLRQAVDYFDRAIARQPDFALAYAAKASVVAPLVLFGHAPFEDGLGEYRWLTARALELDPTMGEAYVALGIQKLFFDWDWPAAERALRRAIELNPNDAHAYHHLGNYLRAMGRRDEAVVARSRAVELDPLNARSVILLAGDYTAIGDHDRAIAEYARARSLEPAHTLTIGAGPWLPSSFANVYLQQGREREAVEDLVRIATLRNASADEVGALRRGFAAAGMTGFWRSWLDMDLRHAGGSPDPFRIAKLLALSGDTAQAFDWLDRAHAERNPGLIFLNVDGVFLHLRTHPRVARILHAMRFP